MQTSKSLKDIGQKMSGEQFLRWKTEKQRGKVTWSNAQQTSCQRLGENSGPICPLVRPCCPRDTCALHCVCLFDSPELVLTVWWRGEGCHGAISVTGTEWEDCFALILSPWAKAISVCIQHVRSDWWMPNTVCIYQWWSSFKHFLNIFFPLKLSLIPF